MRSPILFIARLIMALLLVALWMWKVVLPVLCPWLFP
jgi:hypothetical protein